MIYDVEPNELIEKTAEELKKIEDIKPPLWALFVKTGRNRERPPINQDWWYIRAAAILRSVYKLGPVGVEKLRVKYGGKKGRGHRTEHFYKSSGNILRKILQQLEKSGFVKKAEKGVHKGRIIAPKGISLLEKVASLILKSRPIVKEVEQKIEIKEESKKEPESPVKIKEKKSSDKKEIKQDKKQIKKTPEEGISKAEIKNG